jgi:peptide/nickel transport system substrate-binding protein
MYRKEKRKMSPCKKTSAVRLALVALIALLAASCTTPTPEILEKIVTQVVKETVVIEGTPKVIEREITRVVKETVVVEREKEVEKVIEVTPVPEQGRVLRIGMWSSPQSFNPFATTDGYSQNIMDFLYVTLTRSDDDGRRLPYLADSWEISKDGTEYTFHIREDAVWHDGTPITASDIEMSVKLNGNPDVGSIRYGWVTNIKGMEAYNAGEADSIEGLQIIDEKTVKFVQQEPRYDFYDYNVIVLPAHILGDVPAGNLETHSYFQAPTVGAGPYRFVRYEPDQYVELKAFNDFFLGAPKIGRIIFRIGAQDVLLAQLQKDELDIALVPPGEVERVKHLYGISLTTSQGSGSQVIHVNLQKPYLQDKRVRQAMAYALSREEMAQALYLGGGTVQNSPNTIGWAIPPDLNPYAYSPEKAQALLAEAGWDSSQTLLLRYPTGNKPREMSAPLIQSALKAVGIEVELQISDFPILLDDVKAGNFDLALLSWGSYGDPDGHLTQVYFSESTPPNGWNIMHYRNDRLDEVIRLGRVTFNQEEHEKIYQEAFRILNDELPVIYLWSENSNYAYNNRVQVFQPRRYSGGTLGLAAFPNIVELTLAGE